MTIVDWLVDSMVRLKAAGINGRTDCLVLIADLFDVDKSWVHAHPEQELNDLQLRELEHKLDRRINHEPLAYIRGFSEFYGRRFTVNSQALVPRPESEAMITLLKELELEAPLIADIGTGSGCLGVSAALELPDAQVDLYDISQNALAVARHNAQQYGLELGCYESDLLTNLQAPYDVILANLPYVPDGMITSPEITKEPGLALFSGNDGLNHYKTFWRQLAVIDDKPRYVLTECLETQHDAVAALATKADYRLVKTDVLISIYTR